MHTIPTDKQFTGQRLDSTGLYYYGARYYDPAIGRFISADSMVPNAANPQAFNGYSYVLNNPLKYTDPTGLKFEAGDNQQAIEDAYNAIMNNPDIPQWTKDYMRILHDSERVIYVEFGDFGGSCGGISAFIANLFVWDIRYIPDVIGLDESVLSDPALLASIFAHECYHIYEANPGASIAEEAQAYTIEYYVGKALGRANLENSVAYTVFNQAGEKFLSDGWLTCGGSDEYLRNVYNYLKSLYGTPGKVYNAMPMRQRNIDDLALRNQLNASGVYYINWGLAVLIKVFVEIQGFPWPPLE